MTHGDRATRRPPSRSQQPLNNDATCVRNLAPENHVGSSPHAGGPLVVLMCGPAGSGKSWIARGLERDYGFTRLSIDEAAWRRGLRRHPLTDDQIADLHRELIDALLRAVGEGRDVVVDASFWSRAARMRYRHLDYPTAVRVETWFVRTPTHTLRERVAQRTNSGPDDLALSDVVLDGFLAGFEVPTSAEGALRVLDGTPTGTG